MVDKCTQTVKLEEFTSGIIETSGRSMQQSFHKEGFSQPSVSGDEANNKKITPLNQAGQALVQETDELGESLDNKICTFVKLLLSLENIRNITGQDQTLCNIVK